MASAVSSIPSSPADISADWLELFGLLPGYDPVATAAPGDWFDEEAASDAVAFFRECLQFIEGEKAGQPFELERWQQAIVGCLFGWKRADGTRRYRETMIYVPRKNGKTPFMAGLVVLSMFTDHEPGSQLYSAAAEREQAAIIFRHAEGMIAREPELMSRAKIYKTYKSIEYPAEGAVYKALSSESNTKHGLGAQIIIVDELHAHPNGDLVDVLKTSTAARRQPLTVYITTADYDRESICNTTHDYACKVRDGIVEDASFLPVIYEASKDDDWKDPAVWAKVNPNLGVSVKLEYLERECKRAQEQPTYENTFKRLHLNVKTEQDVRWMQMDKWDACHDQSIDPMAWRLERLASLKSRPCYGAIDLSTTTDLTAYALLFGDTETGFDVLPWFWCPGSRAEQREKRDRVPYQTWARQGWITLTDGDVIDYGHIKQHVRDTKADYDIQQIAYDPWNATQVALQLQDEDGMNMAEFRQGYVSMNEPTKELERLVVAGLLRHGGNPVLRWMASNVSARMDPAGNIKLDKSKSTGRIDGMIATVMGIGLAIAADVEPPFNPGVA